MAQSSRSQTPFRLDRLPIVQAFHWRSRSKPPLSAGELVYYGPMPTQYGIGEVQYVAGKRVSVDFRGTGTCNVHEDVIDARYLIPIPDRARQQL